MSMEKRGVIAPGITPPEDPQAKGSQEKQGRTELDRLEEHVTTRLAKRVQGAVSQSQ